jgi:hypothetical protein
MSLDSEHKAPLWSKADLELYIAHALTYNWDEEGSTMRSLKRLIEQEGVRWNTALAIRRALIKHYLGHGSVARCLEEAERCSETTFYRWKNDFPELVEAIDNSARREALYRTNGDDIAFQARQKRFSHQIQLAAMEALKDCIPMLVSIALGKPRQVEVDGETQTILVYPRDQVKAVALLQKLAREGVLPETDIAVKDFLRSETASDTKEEQNPDWLIGVGVPTDFETLTATTPDGREVRATVA